MQEYIVDLHIHSRFAQATSPDLTVENIYKAAKTKGIHILGTGDCTHPKWLKELSERLIPAESGLYALRPDLEKSLRRDVPDSCKAEPFRFIYTVEVSTIYTRSNKARKVHSLIVLSSYEKVLKLVTALSKYADLAVDGRPTLTIDTEELLKIVLNIDEHSLFVPAHIWTPWFGIFGSKSGFNSLTEAFGQHAQHIYAVESGLDSDPYMNLGKADLDNRTIISTSDAHSTQKLAREATVIQSSLNFNDIIGAIRTGDKRFTGTIEFFPQEGKYHLDGHRKCGVRLQPHETKHLEGKCPICRRPLTLGVAHRISQLDESGTQRPFEKSVEHIVPLAEIFQEIHQVKSITSTKVRHDYESVIKLLGPEFALLRTIPVEDIRRAGFSMLAVAIERMRKGNVNIDPGFDGVFGKASLLNDTNQLRIF